MVFPGLSIENNGTDNVIDIADNASFRRSRIVINGNNNKITLGKALIYELLVVNFKGNNKTFEVKPSSKNINGVNFTSIRGDYQRFTIGENFSCGGIKVQMNDGNETCSIGDNCLFSWGIKIRTSDGHSVIDLVTGKAINLPKDVHIGDKVWVGEDCSFLKGATIPENVVVASNAVVTKTFSEKDTCSVIGGIPAKVLKSNVTWHRMMPTEYNKKKIDGKNI